jgi:hypothetical protein
VQIPTPNTQIIADHRESARPIPDHDTPHNQVCLNLAKGNDSVLGKKT